MAAKAPTLAIEMWSDVVCPFCFVGKRKLEMALKQLGFVPHGPSAPTDAKTYALTFRAFELDPTMPSVSKDPLTKRLSAKFGTPESQVVGMMESMENNFKSVGLTFNWQICKSGNTMDAHRLIHVAQEKGCGDAAKERLLLAYFTEGVAIGDPEALRKVAYEIDGLRKEDVDGVLADKTIGYADVRADEEKARSLGISGVPYFVLNGKATINGAQDPALMARTIERAL